MTIVDPPEGWLYGFPMQYTKADDQTLEEWFLSKGYPQHLIDQGMLKYCRYWSQEKDKEYNGTEGQDRENYSDDQDRESYFVDPKLEELDQVRTNLIKNFIKESNKIEGIFREPTEAEIAEFNRFMKLDEITVQDLERFVLVYQPDARLRNMYGSNVRVGSHFPPAGGPDVLVKLTEILEKANKQNSRDAFSTHVEYETLHPFTDGNGRSGRMLWAWQFQNISLGFLHMFYYLTLDNVRKEE